MSLFRFFSKLYKILYIVPCVFDSFPRTYSSVSFGASYTYRFYMFFHLFQSLTSFLSLSLPPPPMASH